MSGSNIKNVDDQSLKSYIRETKEKIVSLINKYSDINNKKIEFTENTKELKDKAFQLKKIYKYAEWVNRKIEMNDSVQERISTIPKRGEIWTCELGQNIGSEENKVRPVIIVQNNTGNEKGPTTIIVPISNRPKKIKVHIQLRDSDYKLVEGEAQKVTGTILCEQIKVVSKARLGRHIATLDQNFMNLLDNKLKNSLDL
ncbi:type II toxin-antitoxin system PemK/MazF family toxin [Hathewaya histolytica]|uniref:PemK family protein n=1 Tax=Hathewaya histolytica TaxID=1498 RepID=A0A4U9R2J7_HATHI|nr:type II toxin-antitoxin system PemK/MazF family toxin [Hathewaya histolytica]VTQ84571.1 PemK family protein [Hathewaya histolytica]